MTQRFRGSASPYLYHLLPTVFAIGLIWAAISISLWHEHAEAARNAARDTANLARTFDENITRTVEAVDQTLLFVREAFQHDSTGFLQGAWTRAPAFLDDLHAQISLADRDGNVVWSNLGSVTAAVSIADRDHFQAQKASPGDSLLIGRPVLGRVSQKWTIQFVRKLLAPDGTFDGVAVVSLDTAYLSRFYRSISIGNGSVILATDSGVILAIAPNAPSAIGGDLPEAAKARIWQGTTGGAYRAVSSFDHTERIFTARRLEQYPLLLSVGLACSDVFAAYEKNQLLAICAGVLLTIACILAGLVMLRQQRSLLASRQDLSTTLESMSQGILMVRPDGSIPLLNQRAIDLLGLPQALLLRRPTFQQLVEWQLANDEFGWLQDGRAAPAWAATGTDLLFADSAYERTRPNGLVLEVRTQALPDGNVVRTFTDITERKRHEAALAAAQQRAAHAERMQALGQLAGGIAHDFNNVLQAVQGGAALIERRAADPDRVRRFARMILDASARGTSITGRLLTFARRGELRAEAVETGDMLLGLRDVLRHTLGSGITVDVRLQEDLPPLFADKGQLETALVNLATNARDAMQDGGTLTFSAMLETVQQDAGHKADLRAGRYVLISATDTGIGIEKQTLERVLEPFFSTKPAGQGTGLGLSMAKGFADQSGGGLAIDSVAGGGTTVRLWLPATVRAAVAAQTAPMAPVVRADRRGASGRRILLVDDDAMIRETLADALEAAGYGVSVASGGAEALEALRSPMAVDLLVTDLSMPLMNGLAVIRQAQCLRSGLPAVLLTGYAGHGAQLAVGESLNGAYTLLRKPVTTAQLTDRIEALLAVRLGGADLPPEPCRHEPFPPAPVEG